MKIEDYCEYSVKDFIETNEGLVFAVVDDKLEQGKVLCFLRYIKTESGWQKLNTTEANKLLNENFPEYLFFSTAKDVSLHAVNVEKVFKHHQPRQRFKQILLESNPDPIELDLQNLARCYESKGLELSNIGVTGSLLIGAQNKNSDIDLVFYDRQNFHLTRKLTKELIDDGLLNDLTQTAWQQCYQRRSCHLSFADYLWHEQRKYNKALINNRKFDLSLVSKDKEAPNSFTKAGSVVITTRVVDDQNAYDYPAVFIIDHPDIQAVYCFTATYIGQAQSGETIEVAGSLEISDSGVKHIVIGSSREAEGEYIKVLT